MHIDKNADPNDLAVLGAPRSYIEVAGKNFGQNLDLCALINPR
jgi:hypothetical protein